MSSSIRLAVSDAYLAVRSHSRAILSSLARSRSITSYRTYHMFCYLRTPYTNKPQHIISERTRASRSLSWVGDSRRIPRRRCSPSTGCTYCTSTVERPSVFFWIHGLGRTMSIFVQMREVYKIVPMGKLAGMSKADTTV